MCFLFIRWDTIVTLVNIDPTRALACFKVVRPKTCKQEVTTGTPEVQPETLTYMRGHDGMEKETPSCFTAILEASFWEFLKFDVFSESGINLAYLYIGMQKHKAKTPVFFSHPETSAGYGALQVGFNAYPGTGGGVRCQACEVRQVCCKWLAGWSCAHHFQVLLLLVSGREKKHPTEWEVRKIIDSKVPEKKGDMLYSSLEGRSIAGTFLKVDVVWWWGLGNLVYWRISDEKLLKFFV